MIFPDGSACAAGILRRLLLIPPSLFFLVSCAGGPPPTPLPGPHVTVGFPPGSVVNVITVEVVDTQPLRAAELVAPDGTATPASWLDLNRKIQANNGQYAVDNNVSFANAGSVLPNTASDAAYQSHSELLLMTANAEIPLPDPVVYRRDWQHYKIRLSFGAPSAPEIREIAAPAPSAN
jgi:hypothetical protein